MLLYTFIYICLQEQDSFSKKSLYEGPPIFNQSSAAKQSPAYEADRHAWDKSLSRKRMSLLFQEPGLHDKDTCRFCSLQAEIPHWPQIHAPHTSHVGNNELNTNILLWYLLNIKSYLCPVVMS